MSPTRSIAWAAPASLRRPRRQGIALPVRIVVQQLRPGGRRNSRRDGRTATSHALWRGPTCLRKSTSPNWQTTAFPHSFSGLPQPTALLHGSVLTSFLSTVSTNESKPGQWEDFCGSDQAVDGTGHQGHPPSYPQAVWRGREYPARQFTTLHQVPEDTL